MVNTYKNREHDAELFKTDRYMKFIDDQQVHELLDDPSLVEALEQYHCQGVAAVERLLLEQPTDTGKNAHFLIWPAW